jgi:hypothetical protein
VQLRKVSGTLAHRRKDPDTLLVDALVGIAAQGNDNFHGREKKTKGVS